MIGGGFAGLAAARRLQRLPVEIVLVDRRNYHLFQPLNYQVATGALSPSEIAFPLRALFKRAPNVRVLLAEAQCFDLEARELGLQATPTGDMVRLSYDTLIVATGALYAYYGHEDWARNAPDVKTLEATLEVRSRILSAFEQAELARDPGEQRRALTFVIVGGGPTGVEMAGQIAEMARNTLRSDFRSIDARHARVILIDSGPRLLSAFPSSLSLDAELSLNTLGVETHLDSVVSEIDEQSVTFKTAAAREETVQAATVVWAGGVEAMPLAKILADASNIRPDLAGRLPVERDLTLFGHPDVYVIGDTAAVRDRDGALLPGVAPVAIQEGRYAARSIARRLTGKPVPAFEYRDKGNVATIGRGKAVAAIGPVNLRGPLAWSFWLLIHLWYLIGFQNRLLVFIRWSFSFFTHGRGARLITSPERTGQSTDKFQIKTGRGVLGEERLVGRHPRSEHSRSAVTGPRS